jgi:septal ring factor EnvC (AmiA/AmiB activator)
MLILAPPPGFADELSSEEIESLSLQKNTLDSLMDLKQSEVEQLYLLDEQLNLTSMLIDKLGKKKRSTERELAALKVRIDTNILILEKIKTSLAQNLRSFYMSYRPAPAALFSAGDIRKAARQLHYFKTALTYINTQVDSIEILQSNLLSSQAGLTKLKSETERLVQRKSLEESLLEMRKNDKARLLARIDEDVNLKRQYFREIRKDEKQLDNLTGQFETTSYKADFAQLKGILRWPVTGTIIRHFGAEYDRATNTETFSPGIQIRVKTGSEVAAAASGTIVHADYLRGYGNMVILDHGEGWYTLYGHLSAIIRGQKEEVISGEIIGLSGETGSNLGPALFFGIRNRDQSHDPVEWLK